MELIRDLRIAFRTLFAKPGFALLAIIVITSGMTTSVFLFSIVNNTIDAPMPFNNGEYLRRIDLVNRGDIYHGENLFIHEYTHIKESTGDSWQMLSLYARDSVNVSDGSMAIRYNAVYGTPEMFAATQGKSILGRTFAEDDLLPSSPKVAVIKARVWRDVFQRSPDVIGAYLKVNGDDYRVIGVMPEEYGFPHKAEIWLPLRETIEGVSVNQDGLGISIYGLLKEGVSDEKINAQVKVAMRLLEQSHQSQQGRGAIVRTFQKSLIGGAEKILVAMKITVIFIMLLACTNIGSLLFSRGIERNKESAVRLAMGAPRSRLVMQMLNESLVICLISGVLSFLLAYLWMYFVGQQVPTLVPFEIPMWWTLTLTHRDIVNVVLFVIISALLSAVLPGIQVLRCDIRGALQDAGGTSQGGGNGWLTRLVVVVEIFLCTALLIISASLVYQVAKNNASDVGLDVENILTAEISLPSAAFTEEPTRLTFFSELQRELNNESGVSGVTFSSVLPLDQARRRSIKIEGEVYEQDKPLPQANYVVTAFNFQPVTGQQLIAGRAFNEFDKTGTPLVAVISDSFARRFWPEQPVLNKRFMLADGDQWITVVGVVADVTYGTASDNNKHFPSFYLSLNQQSMGRMLVLIKSQNDPYLLQESLVNVIGRINSNVAPYKIISLKDYIELEGAGFDFLSKLFVVFSFVALVLAFGGIYGIMSNAILKRKKEISIRQALGATHLDVFKFFFKAAGVLIVVGMVAGGAVGWLAVDILANKDQVKHDLLIYCSIIALIVFVSFMAIVFPIKKVLSYQPQEALKYE